MGDTTQQNLALVDVFGTGSAGVLGMISEYNNSKARKSAAELRAKQATKKGEDEIRITGVKTGRLYGAQRAAFAANGIDIPGSATALDVLADTSEEGVREAVQIRDNASSASRAHLTDAASESPGTAALGVGLGAAGTVAGKWYGYSKSGLFTPVKEK